MNIDRQSKVEQARIRKMKREAQAWTDRIREAVACPRCEVDPGEYCKDRRGRLLVAIHARRQKLYLLTPSELAPPDVQSATPSSKKRRGFRGGMPKA